MSVIQIQTYSYTQNNDIKTHIHEPKINDILSKLIESKPEQKKNIFLNSFFFFAQFCFQLVLTKCHKS